MPFPWKKAKVTRITRMVADLQSPKRGGSLVVETGFPTSLIDLFVKNRDKLKRPSIKRKKKKKNKAINDTNTITNDTHLIADDPPLITDDPILTDSEVASSPPNAAEVKTQLSKSTPTTIAMSTTKAMMTKSRAPEVVFLAAIRVFAVAALALSTKKLVIGVTLSAFALLFLEFVGKSLVVRLMRPLEAKRDEKAEADEEDEYVAVRDLAADEAESSRSSLEGIEDLAMGISRNDEAFVPNLELLSRDRKWGFLDSNCEEQVLVVDEKSKSSGSSKRAKIRRKIIKKFVPKKLRSGSKKSKKANFVEAFEEEAREGRESRGIDAKEIFEEVEIEEDGVVEVIELSAVSEEYDEDEEEGEEEGRRGREENWVVVTMVVVVLLGLFRGRIFALLLTIVWCFVMKLTGIGTQKRSSS